MEKNIFLKDPYDNDLYVHIWETEKKDVKGVVQVIHGASEHVTRYSEFAKYLNSLGFHVIGNDHLGHGNSTNTHEYVHFADSGGFSRVYEGVRSVRDFIGENYPNLQVVMFAHSMGSFIGRYSILYDSDRYREIILSGTGWVNPVSLNFAIFFAKIIKALKGNKFVSKRFRQLTTEGAVQSMRKNGLINKREEWLTHDRAIQEYFRDSKMCGQPFTIGAQLDLFQFIKKIQDRKRIKDSASSLAIYLISGELDALGGYGVHIKNLYDLFHSCGYSNVKYTLLNNARHEVINEMDRDAIYKMISDWMINNL